MSLKVAEIRFGCGDSGFAYRASLFKDIKRIFIAANAIGRGAPIQGLAPGRQQNADRGSVASAVGMRQEALSRFESGRATDFSLSKLMRLLQVLGHELEFKPIVRRPSLKDLLGSQFQIDRGRFSYI